MKILSTLQCSRTPPRFHPNSSGSQSGRYHPPGCSEKL